MFHPTYAVSSTMTIEDRSVGAVGWRTYTSYMRAAGGVGTVLAFFLLALLAEGVKAFSYWWLAVWIRANKTVSVQIL